MATPQTFYLVASASNLAHELVGDNFSYVFSPGSSLNLCAQQSVNMINTMKESGQDVALELPPDFMFHEA